MNNETAIITTPPPVIQWAQDTFNADDNQLSEFCVSEKTYDAIVTAINNTEGEVSNGYTKIGDLWWADNLLPYMTVIEDEDSQFTLLRGEAGWRGLMTGADVPGTIHAWPGENLEVAH